MVSINTAKRLVKRVILSNVVSKKNNLSITPLVSGKHGIGKSAMIKSIAEDINGVCITIEGGTLKEGEITGLPYQYKDENGTYKFRFLPYYAVDRIMSEEKRLFSELGGKLTEKSCLLGDENKYSMNNISAEEKLELLKSGKVKPVIVFIDEINRTENSVYKELMNILLTRSVNGYEFPWWVLFVGAMNPSTQNSAYATNDMDPAQLDRFLKICVEDSSKEWLSYAAKTGVEKSIVEFISANEKCLSVSDETLIDYEKPTPTPRGWDMVDTLIKSEPLLRDFFDDVENGKTVVDNDLKMLVSAKIGETVTKMYLASAKSGKKMLSPELLFLDDEKLSNYRNEILNLTSAQKVKLCNATVDYISGMIEYVFADKTQRIRLKKQLIAFVSLLDDSAKLVFTQGLQGARTPSDQKVEKMLTDIFDLALADIIKLTEEIKNS